MESRIAIANARMHACSGDGFSNGFIWLILLFCPNVSKMPGQKNTFWVFGKFVHFTPH